MTHPTPTTLVTLKEQFLLCMRMRNWTVQTVTTWDYRFRRFLVWCEDHAIYEVDQITPELLATYRRYLFHYRNPKTNMPLKFCTQSSYLLPLRSWFKWLLEEKIVTTNPAEKLELPKEERRLPSDVLTADEVERLLNATDVTTPVGIRDRAMLETFYSTAMRCGELTELQVYDLEFDRSVIKIQQGKGHKDRVVPIGERAIRWIQKYQQDVRPFWIAKTNEDTLFVSVNGQRFLRNNVSFIVRNYLNQAGITKRGACHLLRHSAATLMMENGADLRALQMLLGHERLDTTQIYTHVSIKRLKEVHQRTHPARSKEQ